MLSRSHSYLIVASEDESLIERVQEIGRETGALVEILSPSNWENFKAETDQSLTQLPVGSSSGNASSLTILPTSSHFASSSRGTGLATSKGAKVLPFVSPAHGSSEASVTGSLDPRQGVSTINQLESVAIENAISAFNGNLTEAAKALGIGRATLYRKVKLYNIDPTAARRKRAAA